MADQHTGGMIALIPADPGSLAVSGGDPADQLHLTLAYLGDDVSQLSDATRSALKSHVATMSRGVPPIDAHIMGHALWNPDGGPDGDMDPLCGLPGPAQPADLRYPAVRPGGGLAAPRSGHA